MPAKPGLLDMLEGDLPDHVRDGSRFVPSGAGPEIEVEEKVERRFLGRTFVAVFRVRLPSEAPPVRLRFRHTGRWKRDGLDIEILDGVRSATTDVLGGDGDLEEALMALDFTRFELESDGAEWLVGVELVGASLVTMALPPVRSYVRLYPEQREALVGAFTHLSRLLA